MRLKKTIVSMRESNLTNGIIYELNQKINPATIEAMYVSL